MPSTAGGDDPRNVPSDDGDSGGVPTVSPLRVGAVLIVVGLAWVEVGTAVRTGIVDPSGLFARSSVLGLYPREAARVLETDLVGVLTVAVGLCVIGLSTLGGSASDGSADSSPIGFRTALGAAAVGTALAVATLPFGPPPSGPLDGAPVWERLSDTRFLLCYVTAWLFPLGVAATRRSRAVAVAGIAAVPLAATGVALLLVVSESGLAALVGIFAVGVALALLAIGGAIGLPLYVAGRALGPRGAPSWVPDRLYRTER